MDQVAATAAVSVSACWRGSSVSDPAGYRPTRCRLAGSPIYLIGQIG